MSSKLELLRRYRNNNPSSLNKIRDSWISLGSNKISKSTKIYTEGIIYKVDDTTYPDSLLKNYLVYCEKEFIGNLNWNNASPVDKNYGEITFGNNIVSSRFYVVLTSDELDSIEDPIDNEFIPFQDLYEKEEEIHISNSDYRRILSCLGSPFISEDELEYTREEINELAIKPALEIMFKWCPKTKPEIVEVTSNVQDIPMPEDAYNVVGLSLQQYGMGAGNISNPLLWSTMVAPYLDFGSTINEVSVYGSPLRSSDRGNSLLLANAAQQGYINYKRRIHYEGPYIDREGTICPEPNQKYITIYSNIQGAFNIWWGIRTLNFDDIEFAQRDNAFKLCAAKVKQLFGNLRRQSKSDIPGQVDYNYLIEEGIKEENEVIDVLKKLIKSSGIIRGSL